MKKILTLIFSIICLSASTNSYGLPPDEIINFFTFLKSLDLREEIPLLGQYYDVQLIPEESLDLSSEENLLLGATLLLRAEKPNRDEVLKWFYIPKNKTDPNKTSSAFATYYTHYGMVYDENGLPMGDRRSINLDSKVIQDGRFADDPHIDLNIKGCETFGGLASMTFSETDSSHKISLLLSVINLEREKFIAGVKLKSKKSVYNNSISDYSPFEEKPTGLLLRSIHPIRPATIYALALRENNSVSQKLLEKLLWYNFNRTLPPKNTSTSHIINETFLKNYLTAFAKNLAESTAKMAATTITHGMPHESNITAMGFPIDTGTTNPISDPNTVKYYTAYQISAFRSFIPFMLFILGISNDLLIPDEHMETNVRKSLNLFEDLKQLYSQEVYPSGVKNNLANFQMRKAQVFNYERPSVIIPAIKKLSETQKKELEELAYKVFDSEYNTIFRLSAKISLPNPEEYYLSTPNLCKSNLVNPNL
ncbi:MAG: hypothetical protein QE271_08285 [Bacteriovoracaceae bacterium]|nr:hypothetical protein [Bacteriovoracaceae bacterium]